MSYRKITTLCTSFKYQNHSLHQEVLEQYTVTFDNMAKQFDILFVNTDTRTCHSDATDMFTDMKTFER